MSTPLTAATDTPRTGTAIGTATGTELGPIEQIPIGEGRAFAVAGEQVAVFRLRTGQVYAIGAVCTHRGGPIADGQIDGRVVMCPLHQNTFELATGNSTSGQEPLGCWPVEVDSTGVIVVYPRTS